MGYGIVRDLVLENHERRFNHLSISPTDSHKPFYTFTTCSHIRVLNNLIASLPMGSKIIHVDEKVFLVTIFNIFFFQLPS